jgi:hypothetical protein
VVGLAVCNPLVGTWDVLPELNCQSRFNSDYGCDMVTSIADRGYAHWLFVSNSDQFHVLSLDVETGHVSLTKLLGPTLEIPHIDYADNDRNRWPDAQLSNKRGP